MALKPSIVVVGLGSIGRRHARLLKARGDLEVCACEPNEETARLAMDELGQLALYPTYGEALASGPDMVLIATPHHLHCEQTVQALAQDMHVLCEKPMSDNLADARRMQAAAEASQAILNIGFSLHFHPVLNRLKDLIRAGMLGTVLQLHYWVGTYITLVNSGSRYQAQMEGALLMDYAHQPDALFWLLGERPAGVYMAASQGGNLPHSSNPNFLSMVCDYRSPLVTTIELNYVQMPQRHSCEVVGDEGWALCDMDRGTIRIGNRVAQSVVQETLPIEVDRIYQLEHQAFLDAVDGERAPASPASEAIVSMEIIDAALTSWRTGQRVALDL
jgi:predicted dehydrogenase